MNSKILLQGITLTISSLLLAPLSAQALTISGTFTDANAWQDALTGSGQDFTLENRSLAGLDCSPYTNGSNYSTLSNFCNTGITSQLKVNDVLSDPEATLTTTNLTSHGIDGSGYSVSYGTTGKQTISVVWSFPEAVQGLFLDFTSSAFTKDTQIVVTGIDGISQVVAVPNRSATWGFIADTAISTIEFIATRSGDENFSVASLTMATTGNGTTTVPSPLLIPGLVGFGVAVFRKQKSVS
ncbi:hypothetical protein [Nodosilinea sp. E11]|uniref:hypothetical protein n=1 Tax=Nodosilinea sp. E11 TaxID=3037479 RepID=UPI0029350702|nr:hypothetical protein [Nodosilinea sp. E11]WOD37910.1 hypothetical protein RRF56_16990 [Nodosilinea sp. E11]